MTSSLADSQQGSSKQNTSKLRTLHLLSTRDEVTHAGCGGRQISN